MINKIILYSTWYYIQYLINRKVSEKECVCVYNHFAVNQKLIQHCKLTILQFKKRVLLKYQK